MQQQHHPSNILETAAADFLATFKTPTDFLVFTLHALDWIHSSSLDSPDTREIEPHYFVRCMMEELLLTWISDPQNVQRPIANLFEKTFIGNFGSEATLKYIQEILYSFNDYYKRLGQLAETAPFNDLAGIKAIIQVAWHVEKFGRVTPVNA